MSVLYGDEGIQHRLRDSGARLVVIAVIRMLIV